MAVDILRHRFKLAEYEAMLQHGTLATGDRVELVTGEIVEMPPVGNPHKSAETLLTDFFYRALPKGAATIMVQQTLAIRPDSMPQPDLMLLRYREDAYRERHNYPEDVLLLVEVSDTTLRYDRLVKMPLYASAGVPEFWIVDLAGSAIEVYREPSPAGYRSVRAATSDESVTPAAFPQHAVRVREVARESRPSCSAPAPPADRRFPRADDTR